MGRKWIQLAEEPVHWGVFISAVLKLPVVLLKYLTFMTALTYSETVLFLFPTIFKKGTR